MLAAPSIAALAVRLARRRATRAPALAPPPARLGAAAGQPIELPLTAGQRALFFIHRLDPGSTAYHLTCAFEVLAEGAAGGDDAERVRRAAARLARHPALRTVFDAPGGRPRQRLLEPPPLDAETWGEVRVGLGSRLEHAARRAFDLERGPAWRLRGWRRGGARGWLLVAHHLIADLSSMTLLVRDLLGDAITAEPAEVWAARVIGERRWLDGREAERQLERARRRLLPLPPALELPTDRPRRGLPSRGGRRFRTLPAPLVRRLRALAARRGATLFALLAAAFEVLIARSAEQWSFALGTVTRGRRGRQTIGYFANPLALCARLAPSDSFLAVIARTRIELSLALAAADYPYPLLVDALGVPRDADSSPLFQVHAALHRAPFGGCSSPGELLLGAAGEPVELGSLGRVRPLEVDPGGAQFDLSLVAAPAAEGSGALLLRLEFDASLFDAASAQRWLGHLGVLLAAAAAEPESAVSRLPLLAAGERHQLRVEWSRAQRLPPRAAIEGAAIERSIARVAGQNPAAVALRWEDGALSYGELRRRTLALAARLAAHGARPESVVASLAPRSPERVVALLAILELGAVYLPLDPADPPARLTACLRDAGARVVVGRGAPPAELAAATYLQLDRRAPEDAGEATVGARGGESPHAAAAAYLIYTSGSTGRPKGVIGTHGGLLNRIAWMQRAFPLAPGDRVLHKTAATFDVSLWELLWPLAAGAEMVLAAAGAENDSRLLAHTVAEQRIAVVHLVPSLLAVWIDEPEVARCRALRWLIASGEALPRSLAARCLARLPAGARLANLYGPTEAAIDVSWWLCERRGEGPVPIGRPIEGIELEVLDPRGTRSPIGVVGEIHIGGVGLARGYTGDPRRTAERFVPGAATGDAAGRRLYRTGDLGALRGDGALLFVRRRDAQIQLHGRRVEPGEIESVLAEHPRVAAAAVVERGGLVAYWVAAARARAAGEGSAEEPATGELERAFAGHLRARLPAALVPRRFVRLAALPTTASGKLDRRALPAPEPQRPSPAAPQSDAERAVAAAWSEVLEVDEVGMDDDFFALGGDSILTLRVRAELERRGWSAELDALYRRPRARELAAELRPVAPPVAPPPGPFELVSEEDRRRLARIGDEVEAAYPLSGVQSGALFHARFEPRSPRYRNLLLCRVHGALPGAVVERALAELIARHEILRTAFDLSSFGEPLQLVLRRASPHLAELDVRALAEADRRAAIGAWTARERARELDWSRPPLLRAALLRDAGATTVLALSFVDAVLDGWSAASLITELLVRCDRRLAGRPRGVFPPPAPYRAFIAAERSAAADGAALERWRRRLDGAAAQRLPCWPAGETDRAVRIEVEVRPAIGAALAALAAAEEASLKHAALAAHALVIGRSSGSPEALVVIESNGRTADPRADATLGMHVNLLPLRLPLDDASPRRLVHRVRAAELAAWPDRRLPFAQVQRAWGKEGLADTLFNFTHFHAANELRRLERLRWEGVEGLGRSSFALRVDFAVDPRTQRLTLALTAERLRVGMALHSFLSGCYRRALERLVLAPDEPLDADDLLTAAQRQQLLVETAGPASRGAPEPLDRAIARRAATSPRAVAAACDGRTLSYGGLERLAGALAARLADAGACRGGVVAVAVRRDERLPALLLAVLKTGAAYLPLDPEHPPRRLALMLGQSGARLAIADRGLLPPAIERRLTLIEPTAPGGARRRIGGGARLEDRAYILYTSGSAGAPKGVEVRHRSLVNAISALVEVVPGDGSTLAHTTLSFDIAALEIFLPLLRGGRIEVAPDGEAREGERLAHRVIACSPAWLQATPATFSLLCAAGWKPSRGQTLVCGGEALPAKLAEELLGAGAVLWNLYGPTETTIWSTAQRIDRGASPMPIGRALANTRLHVVDQRLRAVALGVTGELLIGGEGVAFGYLGAARATAERFVPDPFGGGAGDRLYKSGDLVRWDAAGALCFLGRADGQVKLRGHRIELGEIEAALEADPEVARAVVVLRTQGARQGLVAYVAARAGASPRPERLRADLHHRLPRFMVPELVLVLSELPVGARGKIDRARLPAPRRRPPTRQQIEGLLRRVEGLSESEAERRLRRDDEAESADLDAPEARDEAIEE